LTQKILDKRAVIAINKTMRQNKKVIAVYSLLAINIVLAFALMSGNLFKPVGATNPIQLENSLPGVANWSKINSTSNFIPKASMHVLEGYTSSVSYLPGETVDLHVSSSNSSRYRVEIYRLGWYNGAQARLIGCLPSCTTDKQGVKLPIGKPDLKTGYLNSGWPVSDSFSLSPDAVSGYYLAKLVLTNTTLVGKFANIPFIVKSADSQSPILVQASVNTWQAYNPWGGKSLYGFNSTNKQQAYKVSFDRPYHGAQMPFAGPGVMKLEIQFLESEGYNASYTTDVDTQRDPTELLNHRLVVSSGHDEYWTKEMFDTFVSARDAGVNLAFLGGNQVYWQTRYEDSERTLVQYRKAALDPVTDPALETILFRSLQPPRPECTLMGTYWNGGIYRAGDPIRSYRVNANALSHPWFSNTGFTNNDILANSIGHEWNQVDPNCPVQFQDFTVFFHYEGTKDADMVGYTAAGGAKVFSLGALFANRFNYINDSRFLQFMRNVFNDLSAGEITPPVESDPMAPSNQSPPVVTGNPVVGQSLAVQPGTWTGYPAPTFQYQWQRCQNGVCTDISSANGAGYTITSDDLNYTLRAVVIATNASGGSTAASAETAVVSEAPPVVNLASDGDFEASPDDYAKVSVSGATYSWTTDFAHSVTHSLKISSTTTSLARWMTKNYLIAVEPGKSYSTSVWIKTSGGKANLSVTYWKQGVGYTGKAYASSMLSGINDWTQANVSFTVPDTGVTHIRLEMRYYGSGSGWFDDLQLINNPPAAEGGQDEEGHIG